MNVAQKLLNAPKGAKLYSPLFGEVTLVKVDSVEAWRDTKVGIEVSVVNRNTTRAFLNDGRYYDYKDSECLLFPSRDIRDWSLVKAFREDLSKGTLCLVSDATEFISCGKVCPIYGSIRYYRGEGTCSGSMEEGDTPFHWKHIIPLSKIDFYNLVYKGEDDYGKHTN